MKICVCFVFAFLFVSASINISWARVLTLRINDKNIQVQRNSLLGNIFGAPIVSSLLTLTPILNKIDLGLLTLFQEFEKQDCLVKFGGNSLPLELIKASQFGSWLERREALVQGLQRYSDIKQNEAKLLMLSTGKQFKSFWTANALVVRDADITDVQFLSSLVDVSEIRDVPLFPLAPIFSQASGVTSSPSQDLTWGIKIIKANEVWSKFGTNGQGVMVGHIDSGVRVTHEALRNNFIGDIGWFDPYDQTLEPNDQNGHGTHTMGTIAGSRVGVAPGSTWMSCKGCNGSSCGGEQLLHCGDYMMTNPFICPDLISNSWGSPVGGDTWYEDTVQAWKTAGIMPVFANGNQGPFCESSGSPGDQPSVLGVGATDINDVLAYFSSRGPANIVANIKPDCVAPGVDVLSSWNTADDSYKTISGTSMATPHVAGTCALMISHYRNLTNNPSAVLSSNDITDILLRTTVQDALSLGTFAFKCGPFPMNNFPNNQFGYGRIDAMKALTMLKVLVTNP